MSFITIKNNQIRDQLLQYYDNGMNKFVENIQHLLESENKKLTMIKKSTDPVDENSEIEEIDVKQMIYEN